LNDNPTDAASEVGPPADRARRGWLFRLAPLAVLAGLVVLALAMGWHRALSLEALVQRRAALGTLVDAHYAAALGSFLALYVTAVAISIPGAVFLTIGGGMLFGWVIGGAAAVVGATVGGTLLFILARFALADFIRRRLGPRVNALAQGFRADAFHYLLFLRLVPAFPFWLVNLAPALAGVSLPAFVAATTIGVIPASFAFAAFGAGLDSVVAAQDAAYRACLDAERTDCRLSLDVRAALTPQLAAALTALGLVALLPPLLKRWRRRRLGAPDKDLPTS
jgi:uncharacterized membrane protein YdjX (TVP38/TMEM64 family)